MTPGARTWLRRYGVLTIAIAALSVHYLLYVQRTTVNIVFQDQIVEITPVDKYFRGELTFVDLWYRPLSVHREPAITVINIANAVFFHWNTQIELYIGALWLAGLCVVLYLPFRRSIKGHLGDVTTQLLFLPIVLLVYSLTQWENFVLSAGMFFVIQVLSFCACLVATDAYLRAPTKRHALIFVSLAVESLLFVTSGFSLVFGTALLLVLGLLQTTEGTSRRSLLPGAFVASVIVACMALSFGFMVYLWYRDTLDPTILNADVVREVSRAPKLVAGAMFFAMTFAPTIVSNEWIGRSLPAAALLGLAVVAALGGAALGVVQKTKVRDAFIPLTLIIYSGLVALVILVTRLNLGFQYGMASRYVTHTALGVMGALWIGAMNWPRPETRPRPKRSFVYTVALITLLAGQIATFRQEWGSAPHRRAFYETLRTMAWFPEYFSDEDFKRFQTSWPRDYIVSQLGLLRARGLNVFHDRQPVGSTMRDALFLRGWYAPEQGGRWMNGDALVLIRSGSQGRLLLKGLVDSPSFASKLTLIVDGHRLAEAPAIDGRFFMVANVRPQSVLEVHVLADRAGVPKEHGLSPDSRRLGAFITEVEAP